MRKSRNILQLSTSKISQHMKEGKILYKEMISYKDKLVANKIHQHTLIPVTIHQGPWLFTLKIQIKIRLLNDALLVAVAKFQS